MVMGRGQGSKGSVDMGRWPRPGRLRDVKPAIVLLALVLAATALAQGYCPTCGTTPCRLYAAQNGITMKEPPPPEAQTTRAQNMTLAQTVSQLANSAKLTTADFLERFGKADPRGIVDQIENLTASKAEYKDPQTVEAWAQAVKIDQYQTVMQNILKGRPQSITFLMSKSKQLETRVGQYMDILEKDIKEVLKLGDPPPIESLFASYKGFSPTVAPEHEQDAQEIELREKTLEFMFDAYYGAGMEEQAKALYDTALARWGSIRNEKVRLQLENKAENCARSIRATGELRSTSVRTYGVNVLLPAPAIDWTPAQSIVVNFGGAGASGYILELTFGTTDRPSELGVQDNEIRGEKWPAGAGFSIEVQANNGSFIVNSVRLDLPPGYSQSDMNAIRVQWSILGIDVFLNGRKMCGATIERSPYNWFRMNMVASMRPIPGGPAPGPIKFRANVG